MVVDRRKNTPNIPSTPIGVVRIVSRIPWAVDVHDQCFLMTLARIELDLHVRHGGVYRYRADTYFGGGEWLLLTCWLAWTYIELGRTDEANALLEWVEAQASPNGDLPEQVLQVQRKLH